VGSYPPSPFLAPHWFAGTRFMSGLIPDFGVILFPSTLTRRLFEGCWSFQNFRPLFLFRPPTPRNSTRPFFLKFSVDVTFLVVPPLWRSLPHPPPGVCDVLPFVSFHGFEQTWLLNFFDDAFGYFFFLDVPSLFPPDPPYLFTVRCCPSTSSS